MVNGKKQILAYCSKCKCKIPINNFHMKLNIKGTLFGIGECLHCGKHVTVFLPKQIANHLSENHMEQLKSENGIPILADIIDDIANFYSKYDRSYNRCC